MRYDLIIVCFLLIFIQMSCSSVSFIPLKNTEILIPKPEHYEVDVIKSAESNDFQIVGTVSCQDSASSSIWNWWTDQQALIFEMEKDNLERLIEKVREVGGDVLIDLTHDITYGGSSGGVGVGVGVGVGHGPVGIGLGTSILSGNPRIIVVSYGSVGIYQRE